MHLAVKIIFNNNIINKQIYYGDTDNVLLNVNSAKNLRQSGCIGVNNGELTDGLNKKFPNDSFKNKGIVNFIDVLIIVQLLQKNTH